MKSSKPKSYGRSILKKKVIIGLIIMVTSELHPKIGNIRKNIKSIPALSMN